MNLFKGIKKRQVMLLNLNDLSYIDLPVEREIDKGHLITKKLEGQINHFWKGKAPGWTGKTVRYLGCRGHALVNYIKGADEEAQGTIDDFLRFMWGDQTYEKLPAELRDSIENKVGVMVTVEPNLAKDDPAQYKIDRLYAESLLNDVTRKNLEPLGQNVEKKEWPQSIMEKIPWMGLGALIIYLFLHNNIIR